MSRSLSQIFFLLDGFQGCTVTDNIKTSYFSPFTLSDDSYVGTNSIVYKLHVFGSLNYIYLSSLWKGPLWRLCESTIPGVTHSQGRGAGSLQLLPFYHRKQILSYFPVPSWSMPRIDAKPSGSGASALL